MTLDQLRSEWRDVINEMEALSNKVKSARRTFTQDDQRTWNRLDVKEKSLADQISEGEREEYRRSPTSRPADGGISAPSAPSRSHGVIFAEH